MHSVKSGSNLQTRQHVCTCGQQATALADLLALVIPVLLPLLSLFVLVLLVLAFLVLIVLLVLLVMLVLLVLLLVMLLVLLLVLMVGAVEFGCEVAMMSIARLHNWLDCDNEAVKRG